MYLIFLFKFCIKSKNYEIENDNNKSQNEIKRLRKI